MYDAGLRITKLDHRSMYNVQRALSRLDTRPSRLGHQLLHYFIAYPGNLAADDSGILEAFAKTRISLSAAAIFLNFTNCLYLEHF